MRKRTGFAFSVVAVVVVLVSLFAVGTINASTQETKPIADLSVPTVVAGDGNYYLSSPPNYVNNSYKVTRIFLKNATAYIYADTKSVDIDFTAPDSMFLYIVNGTIRNDYSTTEIIKLSDDGLSTCTIGIDIYLYDAQGNFINTLNRGNTLRGCSELTIRAHENADFETAFVSSIENVAYFEVYVSYFDPLLLF